jgi:PEP-CTERM motif-containing protein
MAGTKQGARRPGHALASAGLAAALVAAAPCGASAATQFQALVSTAGADVSGCVTSAPGGTSAGPISASIACLGRGSGGATAVATFGHVGASATGTDFATGDYATSASAFAIGDVILTGADPSAPAGTTHVSLNLVFAGGLSATDEAASEVRIQAFLFGETLVAGTFEDARGVFLCDATFVGADACGATYAEDISSGSILVPLNIPIQLALLLSVSAGGTDIGTSGSADFSHSLDLPVGRDVFNLADGVEANNVDFHIVDDRFLVPGGVPEPSTWALLLLGFAGIGAICRRDATRAVQR